jgi:hypothetical protein
MHFNIKNLPQHHKEELYRKCDEMSDWLDNSEYSTHFADKQQFDLVKSMLEQEPELLSNDKFVSRTNQVDKYRGIDFWKSFPEFSDFLVGS